MSATYTFRLETIQRPRQRLQYVGVVLRQEGQAPTEVYRTEPDPVMGAVVVDCEHYIADSRWLDARGIRLDALAADDPDGGPESACKEDPMADFVTWTDTQLDVLHRYDALCQVCAQWVWTQRSPYSQTPVCGDCAASEEPTMRPCPFCGSDTLDVADRWSAMRRVWVQCPTCQATGPVIEQEVDAPRWEADGQAVDAWNTRHAREGGV